MKSNNKRRSPSQEGKPIGNINPQLHKELKKYAAKNDTTMSAIVNKLLNEFLKNRIGNS